MIIIDFCMIWFHFDCIMQLKKSYHIASNVCSRKSATTFGDLLDCWFYSWPFSLSVVWEQVNLRHPWATKVQQWAQQKRRNISARGCRNVASMERIESPTWCILHVWSGLGDHDSPKWSEVRWLSPLATRGPHVTQHGPKLNHLTTVYTPMEWIEWSVLERIVGNHQLWPFLDIRWPKFGQRGQKLNNS